jgi:hypothetical protein
MFFLVRNVGNGGMIHIITIFIIIPFPHSLITSKAIENQTWLAGQDNPPFIDDFPSYK